METKIRIGVLGVGAVGGYFGGLLAGKYEDDPDVEVVFIALSETAATIKEKGLQITSPMFTKVVHPALVSDDPAEIGSLDYLICGLKSYDLETVVSKYSDCISSKTAILSLLNGVDAKGRLQKLFPEAQVWEGCVYIISRRISPGVIKEVGHMHSWHFGSKTASPERLKVFEKLCRDAEIDIHLEEDIDKAIWTKFAFISTTASLTSYTDKSFGEIAHDEHLSNTLKDLIAEVRAVAQAKGVYLPENVTDDTIENMKKLPSDATSSMHSDFKAGGKTEWKSLTENVSLLGKEEGVPTPAFDRIAADFEKRFRKVE